MKSARNYPLLLSSQFLSAFADNVLLAVILGQLTFMHQRHDITDIQLRSYNALYTSLFFVPYILLAPLAGYLNDRFAKTRWLLGGNAIKATGVIVAALSVWWGYQWQALGYLIVGIGACIYSPAKYGILPEILPNERLVKANGTVELLTIMAILAGPVTGAIMVDKYSVLSCYAFLMGIFAVSISLNLFMTETPHNPAIRLKASYKEFVLNFQDLAQSPRLIRILLGTGVFWIAGAVLKMNFQPWGIGFLGFETNRQIAELGLWLGVGIIGGSLLAGQLHKVGDVTKTRLYGALLAILAMLLSLIAKPLFAVPILILIGASAGLFLIPLNAALQAESHPDKLGKTIAAQNFVDNLAMIGGGAFVFLSIRWGLDAQGIFVGLGIIVLLCIAALKIPKHQPTPAYAEPVTK
ncbi:MAG: MFS transporter [Verrucomicrobia bacterium]|nr:MFS transporter [Verrucomicrobiota bacterium]